MSYPVLNLQTSIVTIMDDGCEDSCIRINAETAQDYSYNLQCFALFGIHGPLSKNYSRPLKIPITATRLIAPPKMVSTVRVSQHRMGFMHTGTKVHGAIATKIPSTSRTMFSITVSFIFFTICYVAISIENVCESEGFNVGELS